MASIQDLLSPTVDRNSNELEAKGRDAFSKIEDVPETTHFVVEFILDVVCPYCYVGLKNLTAAIATYTANHPEATFEVVCSPYMLDPLALRSAYDKSTYLNIPKHSREYWDELGRRAGVDFAWEGRTGNTRDAHKLLRFALEAAPTTVRSTAFASLPRSPGQSQTSPSPPAPLPGSAGIHLSSSSPSEPSRGPALQLRLLSALLHAHHETSADISSPRTLASLFSAPSFPSSSSFPSSPSLNFPFHTLPSDLSPTTIRAVLADPSWDRAIDALCADARERPGLIVRAVPTFIVNDRYVIGGAQSTAFLADEFARIRVGKGVGDGEVRGGGRVIIATAAAAEGGGVCARFYAEGVSSSPGQV